MYEKKQAQKNKKSNMDPCGNLVIGVKSVYFFIHQNNGLVAAYPHLSHKLDFVI
jgi:hypothetical protein